MGFIVSNSALSFSDGVKPNFSSARSDKYNPATPQASRPTPTPSLDFEERFLYALLLRSASKILYCGLDLTVEGHELQQ